MKTQTETIPQLEASALSMATGSPVAHLLAHDVAAVKVGGVYDIKAALSEHISGYWPNDLNPEGRGIYTVRVLALGRSYEVTEEGGREDEDANYEGMVGNGKITRYPAREAACEIIARSKGCQW